MWDQEEAQDLLELVLKRSTQCLSQLYLCQSRHVIALQLL